MKLLFKTLNPSNFKSEIIELIEGDEAESWKILESDGEKYLSHVQQWGEKGVIRLTTNISQGRLIVEVLTFQGKEENVKDFEAYYLGRFCELVLVNFPNKFTIIEKQ